MSFLATNCIHSAQTGKSYAIIKAIGHGAFGEVLLVEDATNHVQYAAKQLYIRDQCHKLPLRVLREMTALQQLHHPNVVALVDTAADGPCFYLVLELCNTDLSAVLTATNRHLPPLVAQQVMQQLLQAVSACHAWGVLHRDIKPSNLLIDGNGVLKLGDFGLARGFSSMGHDSTAAEQICRQQQGEQAGHCKPQHPNSAIFMQREQRASPQDVSRHLHIQQQQCSLQQLVQDDDSHCLTAEPGTRWYRAPELLFGDQEYGPAIDIWAAGMVFAEVLGLSPLIPGQSDIDQLAKMQQTLGSISVQDWPEVKQLPDWCKIHFGYSPHQQLSSLLPDAPAAALDLLQKMICYNPKRRLTAAAALQHNYFNSKAPTAGPPGLAAIVDEHLQHKPAMPQCRLV